MFELFSTFWSVATSKWLYIGGAVVAAAVFVPRFLPVGEVLRAFLEPVAERMGEAFAAVIDATYEGARIVFGSVAATFFLFLVIGASSAATEYLVAPKIEAKVIAKQKAVEAKKLAASKAVAKPKASQTGCQYGWPFC